MTHATKWTLALLLSGLMVACGGGDGNDADVDFEEGLPSSEMLSLDTTAGGSGGGEADGEYATLEGALEGQPSCVANHMHTVAERVQTARQRVRTLMDKALSTGATKDFNQGPLTCKGWEFTEAGVDWQLRSCVLNRDTKRFAFALGGRAEGTSDAYTPVMGGTNRVLKRNASGKKRGEGIAGFNFDALNTLTGEGPVGKMAIGFRAAGRYRQAIVGVKDFQPVGAQQAYSAVYRYGRAIGTGGFFKFKFNADIFSTDGSGGVVGACNGSPDGMDERGRIGIAWTADGKARMAGVICDGTVAANHPNGGTCVSFNQCWQANGDVSFEMLDADSTIKPDFDATACPGEAELVEAITEAPSENELDESTLAESSDENNPSVEVDTPAEDPGLEAE